MLNILGITAVVYLAQRWVEEITANRLHLQIIKIIIWNTFHD